MRSRAGRASCSCATARWGRTRHSSTCFAMSPEEHRSGAGQPAPSRETIVVHKGHGLPYSKGLMAQALSATALSHERAFELARLIERRLAERGEREIDLAALHELAEDVL